MPNKNRSFFFSITIVLSLLLTSCGQAETEAPPLALTAGLSELTGTVEIKQPDQAEFSPALDDMTLDLNGSVRTADDGRVRLDLSTGTIIRIAPLTTFVLESNEEDEGTLFTKIKIEIGKIWIILNGGSIDVETPSGVASLRGSYMTIWVDPVTNDVWVNCVEGWCQADNETEVLDMIAGQGTILFHWDPTSGTPPPPPYLRYLTQEEIDDFLANNPELADIMDDVMATASHLPTLTPTTTATPTPTPEDFCFELIEPADGETFPSIGSIDFSWSPQSEALYYNWVLSSPSGAPITAVTSDTSLSIYLGTIPSGGTYTWEVTAFDSSSQAICTAGPSTFSKAAYIPTATPTSTPTPTMDPGAGNTVFLYTWGPVGTNEFYGCYPYFGMEATDPEGIIDAWVVYSAAPSGISGSAPLYWNYEGGWDTVVWIPSELNDTVTYYFAIQDGYGNIETSSGASYTDIIGCDQQ